MRFVLLLGLLFCFPALAQMTVAGSTPGSFRVTESGAAEYRIPLRVPPGIAGMEPRLALVYNSQAGNGLLGVGWSLEGLGAITRCPRTLAQDGVRGGVNYDANDRFCLDGQRLMAIDGGTYGAHGTEYRTERESFTKVVSYDAAGSGPAWFKAWTRSGLIIEYGNAADSGSSMVRTWPARKVLDSAQNALLMSYGLDAGQLYLQSIQYTGNAVSFEYEPRSDSILQYQAGALVTTGSRLKRIVTAQAGNAVAEYRLAYAGITAPYDQSRLSSVTECIPGNACFAPVVLHSQGSGDGAFAYWASHSSNVFSSDNHIQRLADVNGDGCADLIQIQRWGNLGWVGLSDCSGGFAYWTHSSDNIFSSEHHKHYFADVNGDGCADLIQIQRWGNLGWVGLSNCAGAFAYWTHSSSNIYASEHHSHHFADINGDGCADLFQVSKATNNGWVGLSRCDGSFGYWASHSDNVYSSDNHAHHLADVNGDGCADLLQIQRWGNLGWVGLSNCSGAFSYWTHASSNIYAAEHHTHHLADVNGDGCADLFQVSKATNNGWVGLANCSGGFGYWASHSDNVYSSDNHAHHLADVNGDGCADLLQIQRWGNLGWVGLSNCRGAFSYWTHSSNNIYAAEHHTHHLADIDGDGRADLFQVSRATNNGWVGRALGERPYLVHAISASSGSAVSIEYQSIAGPAVYAPDPAPSYPVAQVRFPLHAVATASTTNGMGGVAVASFRYGGAKRHHQGRGFLGFRWMETAQQSSGLKLRTENRQDWPYVGLPSLVRKTQSSGALLSQVTNEYGCRSPLDGNPCAVAAGNRYFPFVWQRVESGNDLNGAALPTVTIDTSYDADGNPISIEVDSGGGYKKVTTNTFAPPDTVNWLPGRLTKSTVQSTSP
jgi:hypothetical protein